MTTDEADSNEALPSKRVIAEVAKREGVDPTDLRQPLDDVIDPGALDTLFEMRRDGNPRGTGHVVFEYYGYVVTVESDGSIEVETASE